MTPETQAKEDEKTGAAICAGVSAILCIVAGKDGKVSMREVIKILEQLRQ